MTSNKYFILSSMIVIGISAGTCGPGNGSAESQCRDVAKTGAQTLDALCECQVADGMFPDQQSCISAFSLDPSYYDCACPIFGKYAEAKAYFDCALPAQKQLADCYGASGCDPEKIDACVDAYLPTLMGCEPPPEALEEEIAAECQPSETTGEDPTADPPTGGPTTTQATATGDTGDTTDTGDTGDTQPLPVDEMGCVQGCVADADRGTSILEPSCAIGETNGEGEFAAMPACQELNGSWTVPGDATVCYALLIDKTGKDTLSKIDNMSDACLAQGYNLELQLVRLVPAEPGTSVSVSCQLSDNPPLDCPNL